MASTTVFSLDGQGLKLDTAADVEPHIKSLRESSTVEEIRLGGNTLGPEACGALAQVLEHKTTLRVANLADIFTSRLLSEIPPALSFLLTALLKLPLLHTINLSDNAFGLNTQAPLVEFLSKHVPLRHLILNNNGLGPHAGVLIADALSSLHTKKEAARAAGQTVPDLETVVCGRNRLENGSMQAWAKAFVAHNGLREVKMVQNGIRQEGISHLLREGLAHATALRLLDLQDNTFTMLGSRALAEVAPRWTQLRELGVGDGLLSTRGGIVVAEALGQGKNVHLETLRLQYNDIDSKGLAGFTHAVKNALPALKRIELNGNKFAEEDPSLDTLRDILEQRRSAATGQDRGANSGEDEGEGEGEWGIDSLSDLEEDDEDEEGEEEEEEEEKEEKADKILQEADAAEAENVPQQKDKAVDALASELDRAELK
ncbi:MAG: hypothetical protein M1838_000536 [Thelocarpon superellum]|nr:MAG: hypothetical protein M1838_000536 [Thelocarpon superellum]